MSGDELGGRGPRGGHEAPGAGDLRTGLHGIPAPRAGIDVEAAIAGARRKRRPKTIALSSAATVASVLIVAPFVVPGLSPLQTSDTSMVDSGAAPESAEQPAEQPAPAAEAPDDEDQGGGADGQEATAPEDAGTGDSGASGDAGTGVFPDGPTHPLDPAMAWCGLSAAGDAGLALTMLEAPVINGPGGGYVQVEVTNTGASPVALEVAPVIYLEVVISIEPAETGGSIVGGEAESLTLAPGESAVLAEPTAVLPVGVCGDGTPSADIPTAIVTIDGAEPVGVVGESWSEGVR